MKRVPAVVGGLALLEGMAVLAFAASLAAPENATLERDRTQLETREGAHRILAAHAHRG